MITEEDEETTVTTFLSKFSDEEIKFLIDFLEHIKNQRRELKIPLSIFSNPDLGILESVVKFLKENQSMSFKEIANALNRDQRTIWTSYHIASRKLKAKFSRIEGQMAVPAYMFSERALGPLEALVIYLRDHEKLRFTRISSLIRRNYRSVWLSYNHGIKKRRK